MRQEIVEDNFRKILDLFECNCLSIGDFQSFINTYYDNLIDDKNDVDENIYFVYNHNVIYGITIVSANEYRFSVWNDGKLCNISKDYSDYSDYVIDMVLNYGDTDKVKRIFPNIEKENLENKMKCLKRMNFNSYGYHIK